jgi:L,D-transpeptidase-like protein/putative peptidoglycan binding protein
VRRAPIVLVSLAAWPIAATAQAQPGQAPTLTLKAPKATTYLHTVDFVGRLSPPAKNARVRLMRGDRLVAYGRVRADGVFKILVSIGNPGPFHAAWLTAASDEVTVRIRPRLDVELVGTQVAGAPLRLEATVTPAAAGPIRVRVAGLDHRVGSTGSLDLPTRQAGSLEIQVTTEPPPGYDRLHRELTATLRAPNLSLGTSGQTVSDLARQLAALHYAVPGFGSTFGDDLQQSVYAFQKVQGLDRTGAVDAAFWTRLGEPRIPQPRYRVPANHIEVDKSHQVLYLVRGGQIALISPVSTAGIAGYYTPEGRFAIYRKVTGYDTSPLGVLLDPMYFYGGYAIHGNPSVPPYPASHGCVRVPNFVINRLFTSEPYGETVYVYA